MEKINHKVLCTCVFPRMGCDWTAPKMRFYCSLCSKHVKAATHREALLQDATDALEDAAVTAMANLVNDPDGEGRECAYAALERVLARLKSPRLESLRDSLK